MGSAGVVLVAIALSGCLGLPPKPTDLHTVPMGRRLTIMRGRSEIAQAVADPYSAVYEFGGPARLGAGTLPAEGLLGCRRTPYGYSADKFDGKRHQHYDRQTFS